MIKKILLIGVTVYILFTLFLYGFQRQLIYVPGTEIPSHAEDMQTVILHTDDGLFLKSWYKPAVIGRPTILILHGNAGHIGGRMALARQFISKGYGVFLLEYRGYGGNKGQPTEQGLYRDGRAAYQFLKKNGVSFKHMVLYGESLGTGVATKLASENPSCALVLQSPYTSLTAVARFRYPLIVIPPKDTFDSFVRIRDINTPLLILHGTQDSTVPFELGRELFNHANEPKKWVALPGQGHSNLWSSTFIRDVSDFIDLHCVLL